MQLILQQMVSSISIKVPNKDNQIYEVKLKQLSSQDSIHFVVTELEEVENVEEIESILEKGNIPFTIITEVPESLEIIGVQQFIVIREKALFDSFWPEFPDSLEERKLAIPNETPVIDFNQEMVIAVFLGFFASDGFRIDIRHLS